MATFQFRSRQVELDFPGGIHHVLPLTEEMRTAVEIAARDLAKKSEELKGRSGNANDIEELCEITLDAVDAILGDGAAMEIMAAAGDYSFLDCIDLFKFVTNEFNEAFIREASAAKAAEGTIPAAANRAQRRQSRRST